MQFSSILCITGSRVFFAAVLALSNAVQAETVVLDGRTFTIPNGFKLERAVLPELTDRPIVVDFDEQGNLYVAESSGTNDRVEKQLEDRPHSILRLSDTNDDGVLDQRTVFADRMMFPEGTLWHDGSLYVSAPPQIWKLTDSNRDGIADKREVWFDGKTLTGCANDLHGPYLGPDGWIYWCKGAFAEQTHELVDDRRIVTRAAHIFRRRPEGGPIEPVMTGGMDNPVEVVFTPAGERIFSTTFFQHPANGLRDGLVHAIYGGVYGKRHNVLEGHPRTGDLMPVLTHLGPAAPSGLALLRSNRLGFQNQLLCACFNLHSVTRHELIPIGSTFKTKDHELLSCDDLDFHPTDVIEDADGSVLIVDTGGWYKLCCPTSQLHKPDVLGTIYRLSKRGAESNVDFRGNQIDWKNATARELAELLQGGRPAVRARAAAKLSRQGDAAIPVITQLLNNNPSSALRIEAVWVACRIGTSSARKVVRLALNDKNAAVRQAAAHAASLWRDSLAVPQLRPLLKDSAAPVRRVAAEALGRMDDGSAVVDLLAALGERDIDRVLEHSIIFALIELDDATETRLGLESESANVRRAAYLALHEMRSGRLQQSDLEQMFASNDSSLVNLAVDVAVEFPNYANAYVRVLRRKLESGRPASELVGTAGQIGRLSDNQSVRTFAASMLKSESYPVEAKLALLKSLDSRHLKEDAWRSSVDALLSAADERLVKVVVKKFAEPSKSSISPNLHSRFQTIAKSAKMPDETRLLAVQAMKTADASVFAFVVSRLAEEYDVQTRSLAAATVSRLELSKEQLIRLADTMKRVRPMELSQLLQHFESNTDEMVGVHLFRALRENSAAFSLSPDVLASIASSYGDTVNRIAEPLVARATLTPTEKEERLDELLDTLPTGDIRRGQRIFHGQKTACFACHTIGYRGGTVGPDLSKIGRIRSRRDLLESIIFPNASFVRSYEPVILVTTNGRQLSGAIQNQSKDQIVLQLSAAERRTVNRSEIETILPGRVSIMPAGLDKELSKQELGDLLAFLQSRK